jgi:hypothetical protein
MVIVTVFTKDRIDRSERTFSRWKNSPYPVFVLDDSHSDTIRARNLLLARENGLAYHGAYEQENFLLHMDMPELLRFTGRLGKGTWNLGNNRNYALLLAVATGYRFVIFSDDDVIVDRSTLLQIGKQLQLRSFVGTQIVGMPDHSIVGHLYKHARRIIQPQYTSGTFLGVDSAAVSLPLPNFYNEDWIWLCLENRGCPVEQINSLEQLYYDPFSKWKEKVFFQEEGEILWEGVYLAPSESCVNELSSTRFWTDAINRRRSRIGLLSSLPLPKTTKKLALEIQETLLNYLDSVDSQYLAEKMDLYLHSADDWRNLYDEVRRIGSKIHSYADIRKPEFALR